MLLVFLLGVSLNGFADPSSEPQHIAIFGDTQFVYFREGDNASEASNLATILSREANRSVLGQVEVITLVTSNQLEEIGSRSHAILFPELRRTQAFASALRVEQKEFLRAYVEEMGGSLFFFAPNQGYIQLLQEVFGISLSSGPARPETWLQFIMDSVYAPYLEEIPFGLLSMSANIGVYTDRLPPNAVSIYGSSESPGITNVAAIPFGRGNIFLMGWCWYNSLNTNDNIDGWNRALFALLRYSSLN